MEGMVRGEGREDSEGGEKEGRVKETECTRTSFSPQINDEYSSLIVAQLLYLQSEDPKLPINMYINSPGTHDAWFELTSYLCTVCVCVCVCVCIVCVYCSVHHVKVSTMRGLLTGSTCNCTYTCIGYKIQEDRM